MKRATASPATSPYTHLLESAARAAKTETRSVTMTAEAPPLSSNTTLTCTCIRLSGMGDGG